MDKAAENGERKNGESPRQPDEEVNPYPSQRGYRRSIWRCIIFYPLATLPLGLGLLLAYWFPAAWLRLTSYRSPLLSASHVIVKDMDSKNCVEVVKKVTLPDDHTRKPIKIGHTHPTSDADILEGVESGGVVSYIVHRHLRYIYRPTIGKFVLLRGLDEGHTPSDLHQMQGGLQLEQHTMRARCYGNNSIDVPVKPYHVLLVEEVLHPFYIFQIFSVTFWMVEVYYYYAVAVFLISTVSILISLIQTRRHLQQIHDIAFSSSSLTVVRERREIVGVASESLVPGDLIVLPQSGMVLPCDAALLTGQVVVNEAMLTGESVPVTKTPVPLSSSLPYLPSLYKRHTLFCGTQVVQTRSHGNQKVLAVVVRTGFSTAKGGMIRSILCPRKLSARFYSDATKFVLMLAVLALCGVAYTLAINLIHKYDVKETILRALDVVTIVVPPALPAALTVGIVYALTRLRRLNIFCISPQRVTLAGKVKLVCFDKTGTLTEDSLDLLGVQPVFGESFTAELVSARDLPDGPLLFAMATTHSLATIDGELRGDPIDLKMFQGTGWELKEPPPGTMDTLAHTIACPPPSSTSHGSSSPGDGGSQQFLLAESDRELTQLRLFTFSSELQRMSVIVRVSPTSDPKQLHVFSKGAPETICRLCRPDSVPDDFPSVLGSLTQQGYRVLAVAHRPLHMAWHKAERVKREVVESEMQLAGLVVMQNRLKPQTTPVISTLSEAAIRTVMITGDHLLTGVCVARECGMIPSTSSVIVAEATSTASLLTTPTSLVSYRLLGEGRGPRSPHESGDEFGTTPLISHIVDLRPLFHLAVDGKTFAIMRERGDDDYYRLLVKGTVFARMSPDQKALLVRDLQSLGYGVAMCGDGANDCGALKAAHAGISLSETEASVASPFTSKTPDISCVPILLKEGRCALVTSFSIFKFMALYSLLEFITASILYAYESNLGDLQYLYIDLILIFTFSVVMGYTGPYPRLVKRRPLGTLAGVHVVVSLALQTLLLVAFQLAALFYLQQQPWYKPLDPSPNGKNILSSEDTVLFQLSVFQYVTLAVALSTAAPYRKPLYTNVWFLLSLVALLLVNVYFTLAPEHWLPWLWNFIQLKPHPSLVFSVAIIELAIFHFLLSYLLEGYILPSSWMRTLLRWVRCKRRPRNKYKHLLKALPQDWPPISSSFS